MDSKKARKDLVALRGLLSQREANQRSELKSESGRFTARAPINMAENASDQQELDLLAVSLTASSETLAAIDEAIDRIDAGKFNICDECGKEIGERRLKAQPWARLCVACKRKLEEEQS